MTFVKHHLFGVIAVFCVFLAASATAFTCDDINPKTGLTIYDYESVTHKILPGRDLITTNETIRFCKDLSDRDKYIPILTNSEYGKIGILNCSIVKAGKRKKCNTDYIEKYLDGTVVYLPDMSPGDSIELLYQEDITFPLKDNVWSPSDIYLEYGSPIGEMVLTIEVPKDMSFQYYASKQEPVKTEDTKNKIYTWRVSNVPYYESETMMPPLRHSLSRVSFTSFESWSDVERWFEKLFTNSIKTQYVNKTTTEITKGAKTDREKVDAIYKWVRDNITYDSYGLTFTAGYQPESLDKVLTSKSGDCKAQTALLVAMLKSVGIKAYPVIISYRDVTRDVPGPYSFYHAVTYVPDIDGGIWLDTTCSYCPSGYITSETQNLYSLILLDGRYEFTPTLTLPPENSSKTTVFDNVVVSENGSAAGRMYMRFTGDMTYAYQQAIEKNGESSVREIFKELMDTGLTGTCGSSALNDLQLNAGRGYLDINLSYDCKNYFIKSGKKLVSQPGDGDITGAFNTFAEIISKDTRRFPILFTQESIIEIGQTMQLPKCYAFEEEPQEAGVNESFIYSYETITKDNDSNTFDFRDVIEFKQIEIPADQFQSFKTIVSKIMEKSSYILYPQNDEITSKISDTRKLINSSDAAADVKATWENRTTAIDALLADGKCSKASAELDVLGKEVSEYKPPEVKKPEAGKTDATDQTGKTDEKGQTPSSDGLMGIGAIVVAVVIILIIGIFLATKKKK